ncbi:MAG TPA: hypothetical protein VFG87_00300 [Amycolatopsis sp.]|jgi:hypothetical protein|nr:hypothetical protein [Amycolatopsis sp.]
MTTIFELMCEAARPVLDAVPARPLCHDLYAPHATDADLERLRRPVAGSADPADLVAEIEAHNAYMALLRGTPLIEDGELSRVGMRAFDLMLRAPFRLMLSGVSESSAAPLDVRCYADEALGLLWNHGPDEVTMRGLTLQGMLSEVIGALPRERPGRAPVLHLSADADGVIPAWQQPDVDRLRAFLARKRRGTAVLDLLAFDTVFAEFPDPGFVLIDASAGRHVLASWGTGLVLRPAGSRWLSWWLGERANSMAVRG